METLNQQIQAFYDASSGLWEQVWGEHMHHGYYGADGTQRKDRRQAQIDLIEELLDWAAVRHAEQILDVGCGIGGSTLYLAEKFNAHATGITLSPVQAQRAKERAQERAIAGDFASPTEIFESFFGPPRTQERGTSDHPAADFACPNPRPAAQFLVADALQMPFADQSFDFVWSLESGEHMPDKSKFLHECYRVLKPGGTFLFVTWCHRATDAVPLTADERQHLEDIYRVYCLPYVISLPEYEAIARTLGFQSIRTADWSTAVAPFWDMVIDSAFTPAALFGLLTSGWSTIQAALSLGLMKRGYERGLIKFGLLCATKN
jgi:tocopherol O-methyltransferase